MTRLIGNTETIEVTLDPNGNPSAFNWNGMHAIEQVHQRWEVDTDWWSEHGRVHREYFAVTTTDHLLCVLYRDDLDGEWHIEKLYD
jgi:hypothetical protein